MVHFKKFLLLIVVLLCHLTLVKGGTDSTYTDSVKGNSENVNIGQVLDSVFRPLDRSAMPTSFLGDKAFSLVNHELFDGTLNDSNQAGYNDLNPLMAFWATACIDSSYSPNFDSLQGYKNAVAGYQSANNVPITLSAGKYHQFKDSALADDLVYLQDGQVHDVQGRSENPYQEQNLLAAASSKQIHSYLHANFMMPEELMMGPLSDSITQVFVDFGDGSGYQALEPGETKTIYYPDTGLKTLIFRVILESNDTLYSHSQLTILNEGNAVYDQLSDDQIIIDPTDNHSGGRADIEYGDCNEEEELKRPLIVVEGFDPQPYEALNNNNPPFRGGGDQNFDDFIRRLERERGRLNNFNEIIEISNYDLVYVDFERGGDKIQRNARILRKVIQEVNARKVSEQPNVVLGYSMGGLVARWALKDMEWDGESHETAKFISFDAPHRGANVPLGFQYMFQHLTSIEIDPLFVDKFTVTEQSPELERLKEVYETDAAQQMLKFQAASYNKNPSKWVSVLPINNNPFLDQLETRGWPHDCRNIAIANGSQTTERQDEFNMGDQLLNFKSEDHLLVPLFRMSPWGTIGGVAATGAAGATLGKAFLIPLGSGYNAEFEVYAMANESRNSSTLYSGRLDLMFLGSPLFDISYLFVNMVDPVGVDEAPGGSYELPPGIEQNIHAGMPDYVDYDFSINAENFTFIPTVSALDLDNTGQNYGYDVQSNNITDPAAKETAVTDYEAPDGSINGTPDNERHTTFSQYNTDFLIEELSQDVISHPLTTTYNLGKNVENQTSTNHIINGLIIENGGKLYINGDKPLGYSGSGRPKPAEWRSFQAVTLGYCFPEFTGIMVENDGTLVVGDHTHGREANLTISEGSRLILGGHSESSTGTLEVNGNSKVVIESGADLVIHPGADITLNGDNAELVIKGQLIIEDNATFTFSDGPAGNGKVIFDSEEEDYIQFGQNTAFKLNGTGLPLEGERDEILEIRQNRFVLPVGTQSNDKLMTVELHWGNVLLDEGAEFMLAQNPLTPNFIYKGIQLYNLKFEGIDGQQHGGVTIIGGPNDAVFSNVEITNANTGLEVLGNHFFGFEFNNLTINNSDIGVHSSMGASVKLHDCSLKNNGIGWKAEGMRAACEFTGSIENSSEEGILFRGDNTSSLHVNAEISDNKHGIRFYGNTLRTYCSEIVDNDQNGVQAEWANLHASTTIAPDAGYTDFSGNQTAIELQNNFTYDLFLNEGYNNFNSSDWTLSGWSFGRHMLPAEQNYWGNPNEPIYNDNHNLTSWTWPWPFSFPTDIKHSPTINHTDFEDKFNSQCVEEDNLVDPPVVALALPAGTTVPVINTPSIPTLPLDSALEGAIAVTEDTTITRNHVIGVQLFSEILSYNYQEPKDSTTQYLLDVAYDQMTFNLGRAMADSQITYEDGEEIPETAQMVINTQQHLLEQLPDEGGQERQFRKFRLSLDKALVYKDFGLRAEAQGQLDEMTNWVENQTNLEVIDYWQCITDFEMELVDTSTDITYVDSLYNCTLPEFTPPQEGEEPAEQPLSNVQPQFKNNKLKLYPNPAQDETLLQTDFDHSKEMTVAVHTIQGQKVMEPYVNLEMEEGQNRLKLNTSSLSAGQYFVKIRHGNEQTVLRFTKVNR